ncbi:MAG: hypothetical protein IJU32_10165 [Pyramidobacter sp.]|nr:hypothetical protein [Pyramidobacter sp.]
MNIMEVITTRKSVRTFDGRDLTAADRERLNAYLAGISNPYGIPVTFVMLDAQTFGLSSPVIQGEKLYAAAMVPNVQHCEEAFGYSFEKMVLFAWSLGIGTTWMGGTLDRPLFEKAAGTQEGELMPIASPLGYPARDKSATDVKLRAAVHGDERLPTAELFFDRDFATPLTGVSSQTGQWLEAVRLAPSAANMQPWRIVRDGSQFHFYEKHTLSSEGAAWDVQKIDMGIALCHFMSIAGGTLSLADPGITVGEKSEYLATVTV